MKAAIYNPYLDTLGGGERYAMAVAGALAKNGYKVEVEWKDQSIKVVLEKRFGISLKDINFVPSIKNGDHYDVCFWVSDGSIPNLKARKNLVHFQVPFTNVRGRNLLSRMKLFRINKIVCNSNFTKEFIDREYGVKSVVLYPPVDVEHIKPKTKENIILYVGRFSRLAQNKRQDVLVRAFRKFYDSGQRDWKLILAGGAEVGEDGYVNELKKLSVGYPIKIVISPGFSDIKDLYGRAKIFWSAAGYGVDENKNPEKVEHFGIVPVEAMAAGVVPIIYNAGGHREIIKNSNVGYLWSETTELIELTKKIVDDQQGFAKISALCRKASYNFSYERFSKELLSLL